jgi:hypothetical protein
MSGIFTAKFLLYKRFRSVNSFFFGHGITIPRLESVSKTALLHFADQVKM